jgi:hypothetical protein
LVPSHTGLIHEALPRYSVVRIWVRAVWSDQSALPNRAFALRLGLVAHVHLDAGTCSAASRAWYGKWHYVLALLACVGSGAYFSVGFSLWQMVHNSALQIDERWLLF